MARIAVRSLAMCAFAFLVAFAQPALVPAVRAAGAPDEPIVALKDLDGRTVAPFLAAENSAAIVFLFASVDCPVSNRYAPDVQRLYAQFAPQNVSFWLVYPNPYDSPAAIREHLKAFGYPVHALLDPNHELVKMTHATITPEAAVFDQSRTLAYYGRIDDKFVSLGVERPKATTHDLLDALQAVLAGRTPAVRSAPAVGCYIADFVQ